MLDAELSMSPGRLWQIFLLSVVTCLIQNSSKASFLPIAFAISYSECGATYARFAVQSK